MPLLWSQPYVPSPLPEDVRDEDYVFFCRFTGEVFKDYESFWERTVLCNSLVWGCSLRGGTGLTYEDAVQCEVLCREDVEQLTLPLIRGILYSVTCVGNCDFHSLVLTLFNFVSSVFFVGEPVDFEDLHGNKVRGRVSHVEDGQPYTFYATADGQAYKMIKPTRLLRTLSKERLECCLRLYCLEVNGRWFVKSDCAEEIMNLSNQSIFTINKPTLKLLHKDIKCSSKIESFFPPSNDQKRRLDVYKETRIRRIKSLQEEYKKHVKRVKEDLLCDQLKLLPDLSPVVPPSNPNGHIMNDHFGSIVGVSYFMEIFESFLIKFIPRGEVEFEFTNEFIQSALLGNYNRLFKLFLAPILVLLEMTGIKKLIDTASYSKKIISSQKHFSGDRLYSMLGRLPDCVNRFGLNLNSVGVTKGNITEVIRVFWLISAAESLVGLIKLNNPLQAADALHFCHSHFDLMEKLEGGDIYTLHTEDQLLLLSSLINNIATHQGFRESIDSNLQRLEELQRELKSLTKEESRRIAKYEKNPIKVEILECPVSSRGRKSKWWDESSEDEPNKDEPSEDLNQKRAMRRQVKLNKISAKMITAKTALSRKSIRFNVVPLGIDRAGRHYYYIPGMCGVYVMTSHFTKSLEFVDHKVVTQIAVDTNKETWQQFSSRFGLDFKEVVDPMPTWEFEYSHVTSPIYNDTVSPIHDQIRVLGEPRWTCIRDKETLESQMSALNLSGIREKRLYEEFVRNKESIVKSFGEADIPGTVESSNQYDFLCHEIMAELSFVSAYLVSRKMVVGGSLSSEFIEAVQSHNYEFIEDYVAMNGGRRVNVVAYSVVRVIESILPVCLMFPFGCGTMRKKGRKSLKKESKCIKIDSGFVELWIKQLRDDVTNLSQISIIWEIFSQHIVWDEVTSTTVYCRYCHRLRRLGIGLSCLSCGRQCHAKCMPVHPSSLDIPWTCSNCKDGKRATIR